MSIINPESERRRFKRATLDTPVRYQFKHSSEFGSTLTRDISEGGLRINVDKFVPLKTDFVLELGLSNLANLINVEGKVVWVQKAAHSERYQLGLEFQQINELERKSISDYVKSVNSF